MFTSNDVYDYYITKFDRVLFGDDNVRWASVNTDLNQSTGYFINAVDRSLLKVGVYSTNSLKFLVPGTLIKFVPPSTTQAFKNGKLVTKDVTDAQQTDQIWTKVVRVVGDGTNANKGVLPNGTGPIVFSDLIPEQAVARQIVPKFVNDLPPSLENEIVNQIYQNLNFGFKIML